MKTCLFSFLFILSIAQLTAQGGCTDPEACNYEPWALVDNGLCSDELLWYIPIVPSPELGSTPAILTCHAPFGYMLADQNCAEIIIADDDYCVNTTWDTICHSAYLACLDSYYGCIVPEACNYDPLAVQNDGSCSYTPQWFIPTAIEDPGSFPAIQSCNDAPEGYIFGNQLAVETVVGNDNFCGATNWDDICQGAYEDFLIENPSGCTESDACNYDPLAVIDDGTCTGLIGCLDELSCQYNPNSTCQTFGSCLGYRYCADIEACNYGIDEFGCEDESICEYETCAGCTDIGACNFSELATIDDGSCEGISGCLDELSCQYNPDATCQTGSICFGYRYCADIEACNYFIDEFGCEDDTICEYESCSSCPEIPGCTDQSACNYSSEANLEDDSCLFWDGCGICGGSNVSGCLDPSACNYNPSVSCADESCQYPDGCLDENAVNYNALASCQDGSCIYAGCTNSTDPNYNPSASLDDGTCVSYGEPSCTGDLNLDGSITSQDLTMFLTVFGTECED